MAMNDVYFLCIRRNSGGGGGGGGVWTGLDYVILLSQGGVRVLITEGRG